MKMSTRFVKEQNREKQIEKQMGCMSGFLQIFDRHQIFNGKRLSPSPFGDTASESEKSAQSSPAASQELAKPAAQPAMDSPPPKSPLPLPLFELKQGIKSSWKFCKDSPRLSLDSRANTDAEGGLHPREIRTTAALTGNPCDSIASDTSDESWKSRSPSVVARLMGLGPLPSSTISQSEKKPELRRSASESRALRFADGANSFNNAVMESSPTNSDLRKNSFDKPETPPRGLNFGSPAPWKAPQHHQKIFFDSGDIFPEPKQNVSVYGEIEKKLKSRGIDEPSRDLESLKHILEALQFKGLLHRRRSSEQSNRNFIYDDSPIVVMKPWRLSTPSPVNRRTGNNFRGTHRNTRDISLSGSPRQEKNVRSPNRTGRSTSPTTRNEDGRRSNTMVKPNNLTVETRSRVNETTENRRVSSIQSPKSSPKASNRSPRNRKATAEIYQKEKITTTMIMAEDESSSISESTLTTSTDTEKDRYGKLLNNIAVISSTTDLQPSPVSVLDSSFYKDESSTPSPVTTKRYIDFKDRFGELEEEIWSLVISPIRLKCEEMPTYDCDFEYISDILRASRYLPEDSDMFSLLENQQYLKGKNTSKSARLQRKLIFDTINEILNGNKKMAPWKVNNLMKPSFNKVWSEFKRIRECDTNQEDLFEIICGVLEKDLKRDTVTGWGDCPTEMSESVLDIERLIFKDLISETIQNLAALASRTTLSSLVMPRRKLVF